VAFDSVTEERFTPWYRQQVERDRHRVVSIRAAIDGREPPSPDTGDPAARMQAAFVTATAYDPEVARAFAEVMSVLTLPAEIMSRPGMIEKVMTASAGREPPPIPGPTRAELLEVLGSV
jgi:hypothetical protein